MISAKTIKKYCSEYISKIENYEQAINDKTQLWDCHHRDEIRVLPSGMIAYRSKAELIENNRYYGCPANELIFLTHAEHRSMHHKSKTLFADTKAKIGEAKKGKTFSPEHKAKLSESHKGKKIRPHTAEHRAKLAESARKRWARELSNK